MSMTSTTLQMQDATQMPTYGHEWKNPPPNQAMDAIE